MKDKYAGGDVSCTFHVDAFLLGDANVDKMVNIADVASIINRINGLEQQKFSMRNANVSTDERINIADVAGVINIINK